MIPIQKIVLDVSEHLSSLSPVQISETCQWGSSALTLNERRPVRTPLIRLAANATLKEAMQAAP